MILLLILVFVLLIANFYQMWEREQLERKLTNNIPQAHGAVQLYVDHNPDFETIGEGLGLSDERVEELQEVHADIIMKALHKPGYHKLHTIEEIAQRARNLQEFTFLMHTVAVGQNQAENDLRGNPLLRMLKEMRDNS